MRLKVRPRPTRGLRISLAYEASRTARSATLITFCSFLISRSAAQFNAGFQKSLQTRHVCRLAKSKRRLRRQLRAAYSSPARLAGFRAPAQSQQKLFETSPGSWYRFPLLRTSEPLAGPVLHLGARERGERRAQLNTQATGRAQRLLPPGLRPLAWARAV